MGTPAQPTATGTGLPTQANSLGNTQIQVPAETEAPSTKAPAETEAAATEEPVFINQNSGKPCNPNAVDNNKNCVQQ